jgi:hypothetical protein
MLALFVVCTCAAFVLGTYAAAVALGLLWAQTPTP